MAKNTICLWYDKDAEAAARFYAETFPDSVVGAVHRAPSDYPSGKTGDVLVVEFTVAGIPCIGLNGGHLAFWLIFSTSSSVLKGWVRRIRTLLEHAVVYDGIAGIARFVEKLCHRISILCGSNWQILLQKYFEHFSA
jgi:hypothetical protein